VGLRHNGAGMPLEGRSSTRGEFGFYYLKRMCRFKAWRYSAHLTIKYSGEGDSRKMGRRLDWEDPKAL